MKRLVQATLCLSVLILAAGCGNNFEGRGDAAYKSSKGMDGQGKLLKEKEAYTFYKNAIDEKGAKASLKLRQRFVEMCLKRANRFLIEGSYDLGAVPLLVGDLDKAMAPDLPPELQNGYADLLMIMADSVIARDRILDALGKMDKAIAVSVDKPKYQAAKQALMGKFVKDGYEEAVASFAEGKKAKDALQLIRAEYNACLALYMDSTNADAQKLLSEIRRETVGSFSAYRMLFEEVPDSSLFRKINKWNIYLSVPTVTKKGGMVTLKVAMLNNSNNPQRLYAKNFFIEDSAGNKTVAAENSKVEPEVLDQDKKTEDLLLNFPGFKGEIKKLVYDVETENGKYHSEKLFF